MEIIDPSLATDLPEPPPGVTRVEFDPVWGGGDSHTMTDAEIRLRLAKMETSILRHEDCDLGDMLHRIEMGRLRFAQSEIDLEIVKEKLRRLDAVTRRGI